MNEEKIQRLDQELETFFREIGKSFSWFEI